jgi:Winged helix DNA-binding domain
MAGPRRRITIGQRRARLAVRHCLATPGEGRGAVDVANALVALHATDPATVYLSSAARTGLAPIEDMERALYEDRSLVRMLGMRRTMFVVPVDLAPVVHGACTRAIAAVERRKLVGFLEQAGLPANGADPGGWLKEAEEATVRALDSLGEATGTQLAQQVPALRERIVMAPGKKYQTPVNLTTRVLFLLAADGRIIRGRPRGSWVSSQHRWSPVAAWLPGGMVELPTEAARVELARRWLSAYGPGTVADLRWWTGWTAAWAKQALAEIGPVEVDLPGGGTGLVLPDDVLADDLDPEPEPEPWVALLPALDPTVMGWSGRDWFLGEHAPALFDRSGNPGPTVWCDGRIVGGWAQRKDGQIAYRLLEDVGAEAVAAIADAAERLRVWHHNVRVTPRFRTPLERELSA